MKIINVNGVNLVDFTPQDDQPKGIVHIKTIQRLAQFLPEVPIKEHHDQLVGELKPHQHDLNGLLQVCKDFVAFHETVNLIKEYNPEEPVEGDYVDESNMMT